MKKNYRVMLRQLLNNTFHHYPPGIAAALVLLMVLATGASSAAVPGARLPGEVLLVVNSRSPDSMEIGRNYELERGVTNVVAIHCPDAAVATVNETIKLEDYSRLIQSPIRAYLAVHPSIDFIVLTKGVPIRITGSPFGSCDEHSLAPRDIRGHPSVDSTLAAMGYAQLPGTMTIDITGSGAVGCAYSNRYWNATEPFSHSRYGGYLVTRLDGYTVADAERLIRDAISSASGLKGGKVLFDVQPIFGLGDKSSQPAPISGTVISRESEWSTYNADMQHAHDVLKNRGIPDELDLSATFVGQRTNLLGYFSWGSNDAKYDPQAYQSLSFAPGSIGDTAVSTSGRTFLPTSGGQSLLVDLIAHGLTCGKGYVDEPLLQANASPTIVMERYTWGYTMAESFYAASRFVGWEDVVIGDPLCAPYRQIPGTKTGGTGPITPKLKRAARVSLDRPQCWSTRR